MKRLEAAARAGRGRAVRRGRLRRAPVAGQGLHRARRARPANGIRYLVDPRIVTARRWVTGADEPGRHVVDLVAGRDFTPDGTIEAAEVRAGDPSPGRPGALEIARGIEIGHIFQLGRKYADALGLDVLGPERQAGRGHDGLLRHRRLPRRRRDRRADATTSTGCLAAGGRAVRRAPRRRRQGRRRSARAPNGWPPSSRRPACGCCSTTARASPGVKFNDAELIGVPTIVVVGRGLADGVVEVKDRRDGRADRGRRWRRRSSTSWS